MKRKKKKSLGDVIPASIESKGKNVLSSVLAFGAGALGIGLGVFLLPKVPKSGVTILDKVAPGIAAMALGLLVGSRVDNKAVKYAMFGLGVGGAIDLTRKLVGDKVPFLTSNLPALSGLNSVAPYKAVNQGDYPPSYYKENAFQGLGTSPYALSGNEQLRGMGTSPYALSGMGTSPYALSGVGNC